MKEISIVMFLFKKNVDKSMLYVGISIPKHIQQSIELFYDGGIPKGETKDIQLVIDGQTYGAIITKYNTSVEMMQIHYGAKSALAIKLRSIFRYTENQISMNRVIAEGKREYAGIYAENLQLHFECITLDEIEDESNYALSMDEQLIETYYEMKDNTAHYEFKEKVSKFRKVNQDIIENLKQLYNCRCQICGETIGVECGTKISQAHHIEYFSKSLNNDSDNIIILCPNHHALIHNQNPIFDREKKRFIFPNGHVEPLKLNKHL